ncbi:GNAT family N-acetyltransferase [Metallibacterium sp.]|jgi:predicted GNAT family N-acyltransferase|uniref:GNAT family N-acetyltransferase n=1 Tax=Metallibacterium sp. TaxID=2940281 RepID=UPI002602D1FF|nr:GNAT family N-acetyltransferase [Metallibacterium sp.]
MIAADFHLVPAHWPTDAEALRSVRDAVFIREQQIAPEDEWDDLDAASRHVLALAVDGCAIGCARLTPQQRIGRMAVLADWRGHGVGMALLTHLIAEARALGWPEVHLSAQQHAIPFYARAGFVAYGETYLDADIPHCMMRLPLSPFETPAPRVPEPAPTVATLQADDLAGLAAATLRLLRDAHHGVTVYARDLEPDLLEQAPILEALRVLAVRGRGTQLRLLVQNPEWALRGGHRLLPLIQRLPSAISLRQPIEEADLQYPSAFLLNDRGGYLLRALASRHEALGSTYAPGRNAQLAAYFDQVWARSQPLRELQPLQL